MSEKIKEKYFKLLTRAIRGTHGEIFTDHYTYGFHEGNVKGLRELIIDGVELSLEGQFDKQYIERKVQEVKRANIDELIEIAKTIINYSPTWGEFVGYVVGFLQKEKRLKDAVEILEICEKEDFFWDS